MGIQNTQLHAIHAQSETLPTHQPDWLSISTFESEANTFDKVCRVINNLSFGAGLYGLYAWMAGAAGLLAYGSLLSLFWAGRKIAAAALGFAVYPAALSSLFAQTRDSIEQHGQEEITLLQQQFLVKKIALYKSGTRYEAFLMAHPSTMANGNWIINALGNVASMEYFLSKLAHENYTHGCNTLAVNGPSVSGSGGWPTRFQMGAGLEAGLSFLEKEVKAKHIIMRGFSMGSGMMGEAILQHDFSKGPNKIRYLCISEMGFGSLLNIVKALIGSIVQPIFTLLGVELDGLAAARKLSVLGIRQIVVQHHSADGMGTDGIIPDQASLAYALRQDLTMTHKLFLESECLQHNDAYPESIQKQLREQIATFLSHYRK